MQFFRVTTGEEVMQLAKMLPSVIAMDTEYVKGNPLNTKLLSIIISNGEWAYAVEPEFLPLLVESIKSRSLILLQDFNHCDTIILYQHGCDLRNTYCLNLIDMHHLINENLDHDLGSRVLARFGDNYKEEFWSKYKNFEDAPAGDALEYQCKDGIYTYRLGIEDMECLQGKEALLEHTRRMSLALLDTELSGLRVDEPLIRHTQITMSKQIEQYLPKLREEFLDYCQIWEMQKWAEKISKLKTDRGRQNVKCPSFSFASDKQLSWLLYEGLHLPVISKTKTGNPSTDYDTLHALVEDHPEIKTIVDYKDTKTIYSTFVEGMLNRIDLGRIYPHFNVSGTATGRISHSDPNMGNLPKEGVIRNFFIPYPGMTIIGADYAQLEVVIEANLTEDKSLLKIVLEGASKHDITAQGLGVSRSTAKTLNFALQYGAGVHKVSKILSISYNDALDIFTRYWELYSGVKALKDQCSATIAREGQITNLFGRTRHFDKPNNEFEKARQERQAYNFLIQGVAGDACNRAYYQFHEYLKAKRGLGRTLFPVHDEIVAEVIEFEHESCKAKLCSIMEDVSEFLSFKYPLKATAYGPLKCWAKA